MAHPRFWSWRTFESLEDKKKFLREYEYNLYNNGEGLVQATQPRQHGCAHNCFECNVYDFPKALL